MSIPDLVVVGNLIVDDLVFLDGTTRMGEAGGAVLYAALGAALWGTRVGVVSLAGDDYPTRTLEALAHRGVDLAGVRRLARPGLRAWLLYEPEARHLVHWLGRPTHDLGSPLLDDVPAAWQVARSIHLTPSPLAVQSVIVDGLSARAGTYLSVDPHTPIAAPHVDEWRRVLEQVDLLFVSDTEIRPGDVRARPGEDADPAGTAVEDLSRGRLRDVALKQGERGGTLYHRGSGPVRWVTRTAAVVDPTGAGDAFAGGFLSARLAGAAPETALEQGLVSASFAMEAWGAAGLLAASADAARRRFADWFSQSG